MKKVTIAFDVDGTLRCNCTATCRDVNRRIADLLFILSKFKNTQIIVWSGGGAEYARNFFGRPAKKMRLKDITYASKDYRLKPDIAIDDIQDCELGVVNLIVREK